MSKPMVNRAAKRRLARRIDAAKSAPPDASNPNAPFAIRAARETVMYNNHVEGCPTGLKADGVTIRGSGNTFRRNGTAIDATDSELNLTDTTIE